MKTSTTFLSLSLVLFAALLPLKSVFAQSVVQMQTPTEYTSTQVNFNSPAAYAFAEYVVNPVSYYTGIPEIAIPLYEIKLKDYSLPISLSYHAGGIKVEEVSSSVGLGWNLNAGGVITRSVKDRADDTTIDECENRWLVSEGTTIPNIARYSPCGNGLLWALAEPANANFNGLGSYDIDLNTFNGNPDNSLSLIKKFYSIAERTYTNYKDTYIMPMSDKEPDIFYFNFAGRRGQFVFDMTSGSPIIRMTPYQDLQIEYTTDSKKRLNSFKITDERGVIYFFQAIETSLNTYHASPFNKDDIMEAGYATGIDHVKSFETGSGWTKYNSSWFLTRIETPLGEYLDFSYQNEIYDISARGPQQTALYFLMPTPANPYITFNYDPNDFTQEAGVRAKGYNMQRTSILTVNGKRLSSIENNSLKIQFDAPAKRQDLLDASPSATASPSAISEITVINKIGGDSRIRKFKLTQDYFTSDPLEYVNKKAGYYSTGHEIEAPDSSYAYKRLRLKSVQEFGKDDTTFDPPFIFTYKYFDYTGINTHRLPHRLSFQQDIWGYYNGAFWNNTLIPAQYIYPDHYPIKDSRQFRVYYKQNFTGREYWLEGAHRLPYFPYCDIGMLTKITYPTQGFTEYQYEIHTFRNEQQDYIGGGTRIKKITKSDGLGASPNIVYDYAYTNADNTSSGNIISMPVFAARINANNYSYTDYSTERAYKHHTVRYGSPQALLGNTSGSYVGYRTVVESIPGNGKTVRTYSMPATWHVENDIPISSGGVCDPAVDGHCDGFYQLSTSKDLFISTVSSNLVTSNYDFDYNPAAPNAFPFSDNPNYDWQRGHLLSEKTYNNGGAIVKEVQYEYGNYFPNNLTAPKTVYGYKVVHHYPNLRADTYPARRAHVFRVSKYSVLTEVAKVLKTTKETIYDLNNVNKKLVTSVALAYNGTNHKEITSITSSNSEGKTLTTSRKFPEDFSANEFGSNLLVPKHIQGVPLQQVDFVDGIQTGKKETTYTLSNNKVVPGSITNYRDGSNSPDRVTLEYDAVGNLLQSTPIHDESLDGLVKFKGNPISYLWGYDNTLPIAKAENALAKDVFFTSFEDEEGTSSTDDSRTGHKSRPGGYIKTLTNLTAGSYVLTYWKKSGSDWILEVAPVNVTGDTYTVNVAPSLQIDDLRFHPSNTRMLTYTYDPLIGMTSMTDENNVTTYFEFDNNNRLKFVKDFEKKILKQHLYHFKGQP